VAVQILTAFIRILSEGWVLDSPELHVNLANTEPMSGVAVRVTVSVDSKLSVQ